MHAFNPHPSRFSKAAAGELMLLTLPALGSATGAGLARLRSGRDPEDRRRSLARGATIGGTTTLGLTAGSSLGLALGLGVGQLLASSRPELLQGPLLPASTLGGTLLGGALGTYLGYRAGRRATRSADEDDDTTVTRHRKQSSDFLAVPAAAALLGGTLGATQAAATDRSVKDGIRRGAISGLGIGLGGTAGLSLGALTGYGLGLAATGLRNLPLDDPGRLLVPSGLSLIGAVGGGLLGAMLGRRAARLFLPDDEDDNDNRRIRKLSSDRLVSSDYSINDFIDDARWATRQELKDSARRHVLLAAVSSLLAGAAARGLYALADNRQRATPPPSVHTQTIALPVKTSSDDGEVFPKLLSSSSSADVIRTTDWPTRRSGLWWYLPSVAAATGGGLLAGYYGVDHLLRRRRQRKQEKELADAKADFEAALREQFDSTKTGSDSELGRQLDRLHDLVVRFGKQAASWSDWLGTATGLYATAAGLGALLTAALVYDNARKRNRRKIMEQAIDTKMRREFAAHPPEIVAVPASESSSRSTA